VSWQSDREAWNQDGKCAREACKAELRESWRHPTTGLYYCTGCHRLLEEHQAPMKMELVRRWKILHVPTRTLIADFHVDTTNPYYARVTAAAARRHPIEELRALRCTDEAS